MSIWLQCAVQRFWQLSNAVFYWSKVEHITVRVNCVQYNAVYCVLHCVVAEQCSPMETLSRAIGQSHFGHFSLCIFILLTTHSLLTVYGSSDDVEDDDDDDDDDGDDFSLCTFILLTTHSLPPHCAQQQWWWLLIVSISVILHFFWPHQMSELQLFCRVAIPVCINQGKGHYVPLPSFCWKFYKICNKNKWTVDTASKHLLHLMCGWKHDPWHCHI